MGIDHQPGFMKVQIHLNIAQYSFPYWYSDPYLNYPWRLWFDTSSMAALARATQIPLQTNCQMSALQPCQATFSCINRYDGMLRVAPVKGWLISLYVSISAEKLFQNKHA